MAESQTSNLSNVTVPFSNLKTRDFEESKRSQQSHTYSTLTNQKSDNRLKENAEVIQSKESTQRRFFVSRDQQIRDETPEVNSSIPNFNLEKIEQKFKAHDLINQIEVKIHNRR